MSATTIGHMSNSRASSPLARLRSAVEAWRRRAWEREALASLDERDLHDLGLSRAAAAYEAGKPFWRA